LAGVTGATGVAAAGVGTNGAGVGAAAGVGTNGCSAGAAGKSSFGLSVALPFSSTITSGSSSLLIFFFLIGIPVSSSTSLI
jgi:hypothetical protein